MHSIEEIRAKLQEMENREQNRDKSIYPFWNMPDNSTAVLRFLPDGNDKNVFFWVERQIIRIPFEGTTEEPNRKIEVIVPCMDMYNTNPKIPCPITRKVSKWFNDDSMIEVARKYWKKKSYIFQGFVVEDPLKEKDVPENPIRRFVINPSILKIIKSSLLDPDIEDSPVDFVKGRDFRLSKTRKGQFADYSTSKWAMKTRPLNEMEMEAIETYGLADLSSYLPKMPTQDELHIIEQLFEDSINGKLYDVEKYSRYYKPSMYGNGESRVAEIEVEFSEGLVENKSNKFSNEVGISKIEEQNLNREDNIVIIESAKEENIPVKRADPAAILAALKSRQKK